MVAGRLERKRVGDRNCSCDGERWGGRVEGWESCKIRFRDVGEVEEPRPKIKEPPNQEARINSLESMQCGMCQCRSRTREEERQGGREVADPAAGLLHWRGVLVRSVSGARACVSQRSLSWRRGDGGLFHRGMEHGLRHLSESQPWEFIRAPSRLASSVPLLPVLPHDDDLLNWRI